MNKKIFTPLFVAASFLLVGCSTDTIVSRPSWINDDIIDVEGLKDNKMKEIYDAIKELGDTNANVLNKVMYDIAKEQLGKLDDLKKFKDPNTSADELKAFVETHKMYQPDSYSAIKDAEGNVTVKELENLTDDEKNTISRDKIEQQYTAVIERVCEMMYEEVKGGSYYTDGINKLFSETEYIRHLRKELYYPDTRGITPIENKVFVPKSIDDPNDNTWEKHANKYLNLTDGNGNFKAVYYPTDTATDPHYDGGYIGRKILPDVYRELLIQNYVREQRYTNLGRGYARKAKMIKIASGSHNEDVLDMLNYYALNHITGDGVSLETRASYASLDDLNKAMIGIADIEAQETNWGVARTYLENGTFEKIGLTNAITTPIQWKMHIDENGAPTADGKTTYVFAGTKLGDLVETFKKAFVLDGTTSDPDWGNFTPTLKYPFDDEVKTAYNDLTNNGAYPVEIGIQLKERELLSNDLTQDGWFMKNGGLTDLNDKFRDNLFSITTSNIIDAKESMTIGTEAGEIGWGTYTSDDTARYFQTKDGAKHAYLVDSTISADEPWKSVVLKDDSNNFYIVEIEEAASLAKLSLDDSRAYIKLRATDKYCESNKVMNEIVRSIAKQVGSDDTYKKNAEQYYLMISNILFYDQSVYDYFKSQFPDLFK